MDCGRISALWTSCGITTVSRRCRRPSFLRKEFRGGLSSLFAVIVDFLPKRMRNKSFRVFTGWIYRNFAAEEILRNTKLAGIMRRIPKRRNGSGLDAFLLRNARTPIVHNRRGSGHRLFNTQAVSGEEDWRRGKKDYRTYLRGIVLKEKGRGARISRDFVINECFLDMSHGYYHSKHARKMTRGNEVGCS